MFKLDASETLRQEPANSVAVGQTPGAASGDLGHETEGAAKLDQVLDQPLPQLRDDLELVRGPTRPDGSPSWTIHDPLRNRFFRFGWMEFEMLSRWDLGTGQALLEAVNLETTLQVTPEQLQNLLLFLFHNRLIRIIGDQARQHLMKSEAGSSMAAAQSLLHKFMFLKIPLIRPDPLLTWLLPVASLIYSRVTLVAILLAAMAGTFLVARRWDEFLTTFLYFFTFEGLFFYALAIVGTQVLHELGHALTAKRYGLRVATMGIAFIFLFPVFYTDTSDAWRLRSRSARIAVGAAGMIVELALATVATLMWSFLSDGPLKSAMFLLATVSWLTTLAVNMNPFIRFDGYYILSDILDIENLHGRSFEFGRWWLRRVLFGLRQPPPEELSSAMRWFLIAFAFTTWVYRFFLFLAIAVVVYYLVFKLLGIALMVFEVGVLVVLPIVREVKLWWGLREHMRFNLNIAVTAVAFAGLGALIVIPWQTRVEAPAVLKSARQSELYAPRAARLDELSIKNGDVVENGVPLVVLSVPELRYQVKLAEIDIETLRWQLSRLSAAKGVRDRTLILQRELDAAMTKLRGLEADQDRLTITAPFDGMIVDLNTRLKEGNWINVDNPIATVIAMDAFVIEAYVQEDDLDRIAVASEAQFFAESSERKIDVAYVSEIDSASSKRLENPYVVSQFGGSIATRVGIDQTLVPEAAIYRVLLTPREPVTMLRQVERGTIYITAERRSLLSRAWQHVAVVLIRESGF